MLPSLASLEARYTLSASRFAELEKNMATQWLKPDEIFGVLVSYQILGLPVRSSTQLLPPCVLAPAVLSLFQF